MHMCDVVISAEGLGKQYRIGQREPMGLTLRDQIVRWVGSPYRRWRTLRSAPGAERDGDGLFWALRNVSFSVRRGEVMGVIGRNGSGKSTLLKILSRITEPTEGRAVLRGRVASLLEVGTGFHPELTGRENIYLNGSILGMRKTEVDRKFDQIVAFSEIERFLDTPVKRYSSGMYVRLAFAVAAHLEPEILIVDEVLAVGDQQFQKKCLGKMHEVASGEGRTVIFVSHNMAPIRSLCDSCCLLENGTLSMRGPADECVTRYMSRALTEGLRAQRQFERPGHTSPWIHSARLLCDGKTSTVLPMGGRLGVEVEFRSDEPMVFPKLGVVLSTLDGDRLIFVSNRYLASPEYAQPVREGIIRCDLGVVPLVAKTYSLSLILGSQHETHRAEEALTFEVIDVDIWGSGRTPVAAQGLMWWPADFEFASPDGQVHRASQAPQAAGRDSPASDGRATLSYLGR
jgi:lipopolysaccharide transport system ATP-binding protein